MDPENTHSNAPNLWLRILLIVVGIIFAFILITLVDRITGIVLNNTGFFLAVEPNHSINFNTIDYSVKAHISSQGIRNPEIPTKKPKDEYRILALGDSFTFGQGVQDAESWPRLIEKSMTIPNKKLQVINAGVIGIYPSMETSVCQAYANRFHADEIILGLYIGDDLVQETQAYPDEENKDIWEKIWPTLFRLNSPLIAPEWGGAKNLPYEIETASFWKPLAQGFYSQNPTVLDTIDPRLKDPFLQGKINPYILFVSYQDPYFLLHILESEYYHRSLYYLANTLKRIRDCAQGRPVTLLLIPSYELVSKDFFQYRQAWGYKIDDKLLTFNPDQDLTLIAKRLRFGYVSALPSFRRDGCKQCYYLWDQHLTAYGQKRVASVIEGYWEKKKSY